MFVLSAYEKDLGWWWGSARVLYGLLLLGRFVLQPVLGHVVLGPVGCEVLGGGITHNIYEFIRIP